MSKDKFLKEGDVIQIEMGMKVYAKIPEHFVYSNRPGSFDTLTETDLVVGKISFRGFDSSYLAGTYIVTRTSMSGGGTGHGPGDVYPDGHYVTAIKAKIDEDDEDDLIISFYQSGCFTAMIDPSDIKVLGTAKKTYTWEAK